MGKVKRGENIKSGLRVVALFEATKGALVLVVGFGLLAFIHKDLHLAAERLVRHLHLNPARHYPRIFIDAANHVTDGRLLAMAIAALSYSVVRFVEAFGLWRQRQWAEWFGLLTGGMYIPVELYENLLAVTWPRAVILTVNAAIVLYLVYVLYRSRKKREHAGK
jgi:uncharacterized membrane protein (DUF2068 family)